MAPNYVRGICVSIALLAGSLAGACGGEPPDEGSEPAETSVQELSRTWTCSATLSYGTHSYTPEPWSMSSHRLFPDREDYCRDYIKSHWLSDPSLFELLGVSPEENRQICENGGRASVRVDYGFDARNKSWQFTSSVAAACPTRSYACGFAMSGISGEICENGRTTRYVSATGLTEAISACQAARPADYPYFCVVLDLDGTAPSDVDECEAAPRLGPSGLAPVWRPGRSCCRFEGDATCPN